MRGAEARLASNGDCPACGKVRYGSRDAARHAARITGAKFGCRMRAYECSGYWHLTSMDAASVAALKDGPLPARCAACGMAPYRTLAFAQEAAEARMASAGGYCYPWSCGEWWHLKSFRWSGRHGKGARKQYRADLRKQADRRDQLTPNSRRASYRDAQAKRQQRPRQAPADSEAAA